VDARRVRALQLGEPPGRIVEDPVRLERGPEPARRTSPAAGPRRPVRLERALGVRTARCVRARQRTPEPLAQSVLVEPPPRGVAEHEQVPLLEIRPDQQRHGAAFALRDRLERGAGQQLAVLARLPGE
jgi:hypothetical protein